MSLEKTSGGAGFTVAPAELIAALKNKIGMKGLMIGAGGLLGLGLVNNLLEETVDSAADIMKSRYKTVNDPTWKELGKAKLYGDYDDVARFTRAKEMLYSATYDKPLDLLSDQIGGALDKVQSNYAKQFRAGDLAEGFESLKGAPEVKALGEAKARMMYDQISKIAPDVIRGAPSTALSVFQSAIASDSTSLRPDLVANLAKAQHEMNSKS